MKLKIKTNRELLKTLRRDWGGINPITRTMKDKTKYTRKTKHKRDYRRECCD